MGCAPHRILANNRNFLRTATLTPSSVKPVENTVIELPVPRDGTASVALTGAYSGFEESTIDVQIIDTDVDTKLASAPVFTGVGSGSISDIVATSLAPQGVVVQLKDAGIPQTKAGVDFEGVRIVARTAGAAGNDIRISIDQSPLVFDDTDFSLLEDLKAGAGGETTGLFGSAYDWDTAVLGADDVIPATAHRIAFGDDRSAVYLAYKQFVDNRWSYHFVPEILRDVPRGTLIKFVSGGRDVTVSNSTITETYTDVATVYDLLSAIKAGSALVDVAGVVAKDRSPTGQASRELLARTDARFEPSTGTGSRAATGFVDVSVDADAGTELVTATCFAVNPNDYPLAHLGNEYWNVTGSLSGDLGFARTGIPFAGPNWQFTIPTKLPIATGQPSGKFSVTEIVYVARLDTETTPPICPVALTLGPAAIDQTITLRYTVRPSGDCDCTTLDIPDLDTVCLGNTNVERGSAVSYRPETVTRLTDLYDWYADTVRDNSGDLSGNTGYQYTRSALTQPIVAPPGTQVPGTNSVEAIAATVRRFEKVLGLIDKTGDTEYATGAANWDTALTEFKSDVATDAAQADWFSFYSERPRSRLDWALVSAGVSPLGKTDASILESGDGCWQDLGDAMYWTVVGSEGGEYAYAFTNNPYYSSRKAKTQGAYFSTKEFAFQINVVESCIANLKEGDEIHLAIGNATAGATYQVGDELVLGIVSAQPLYLAGGQDGNKIQHWTVTADVTGPLTEFVYDPDAPAAYNNDGLQFTLLPGGIDFAAGDRFSFQIGGGHWQWRQNGGAWQSDSPPSAIPSGTVALVDGLSITFTPGEAPAFVAGDMFSFRVLQPGAASNLQTPGVEGWEWSGGDPTHLFDLGAVETIENAAFALHTLPAGASITLDFGTAPGVYTDTETLTWREGVMFAEFSHDAQYVRMTVNDAAEGKIGWGYIGPIFAPGLQPDVDLRRDYRVDRGDGGVNVSGRFIGKAVSGDVEWTEGSIDEADQASLEQLADWLKEHDDEPFIFVPNVTRPERAFIGRLLQDQVEFPDVFRYGPNAGAAQRFSAKFAVSGLLQ